MSRLSVEKTSPAPLLGVVPRTPSPGPCRAREIVAAPPDKTPKDVLGMVIAKTSYSLLRAPLPPFRPSDTVFNKAVRSSPPLSLIRSDLKARRRRVDIPNAQSQGRPIDGLAQRDRIAKGPTRRTVGAPVGPGVAATDSVEWSRGTRLRRKDHCRSRMRPVGKAGTGVAQ